MLALVVSDGCLGDGESSPRSSKSVKSSRLSLNGFATPQAYPPQKIPRMSSPQLLPLQAHSPWVEMPQMLLALCLPQPEQSNPEPPMLDVIVQVNPESHEPRKATRHGRGQKLRMRKSQPTSNAEIVHWAASDNVTGCRWEFPN